MTSKSKAERTLDGKKNEDAPAGAQGRYAGRFCDGEGDGDFLRLIDESFAKALRA